MLGLLIRDGKVLYERYMKKTIPMVLGITILMCFLLRFAFGSTLSILLPMSLSTLVANVFTEDEKDNWFKYLKTLPVRTIEVVGARFILTMILLFISVLYAFILNMILFVIFKEQEFELYLIFSIVGFIISLIVDLMMLPACYKFGSNGISIVSLPIILLVSGFLYISKNSDISSILMYLMTIPKSTYILIILFLMLMFIFISIFLSAKILKKKILY